MILLYLERERILISGNTVRRFGVTNRGILAVGGRGRGMRGRGLAAAPVWYHSSNENGEQPLWKIRLWRDCEKHKCDQKYTTDLPATPPPLRRKSLRKFSKIAKNMPQTPPLVFAPKSKNFSYRIVFAPHGGTYPGKSVFFGEFWNPNFKIHTPEKILATLCTSPGYPL